MIKYSNNSVKMTQKSCFLVVAKPGFGPGQGLSRICVQRVIWTRRTLFFDSLDTQKFMSEFADDDFS